MKAIRKAGQYLKEHPVQTALIGGGSILGSLGLLRSLTKPEMDYVIGEAIAQEQDGTKDALGLGSTGLLSAALILGLSEEDEDLLKRVTTTPGRNEVEQYGVVYSDPMGDRRYQAVDTGRQRVQAPLPKHVIRGRRY